MATARWLLAMGTAAVCLLPASGVVAGTECVTYYVKTPMGTWQGSPCPVNAPPPFSAPLNASNCQGVPPAGAVVCVGVRLHIPYV